MNPLKTIKILSYVDASLYAMTVTLGETVPLMYFSQGTVSPNLLGLISTLPCALGALVQVFSPYLKRFWTEKSITLFFASLQLFGLVLLSFFLSKKTPNFTLLWVSLSLYWIGGLSAGSAWQAWISKIFPDKAQNMFLAKRGSFINFVTLTCFLGLALYLGRKVNQDQTFYFVLGSILARAGSIVALFLHPKLQKSVLQIEHKANKSSFQKSFTNWPKGLLLSSIAFLIFKAAVATSSPFYGSYMLQELHMPTSVYTLLIAVPLLARSLALPRWGELLDSKRIFESLLLCGFFVSILPAFWALYAGYVPVTVLQILSGIMWSGFELISIVLIKHLFAEHLFLSLCIFHGFGSMGSVFGAWWGGLWVESGHSFSSLFPISALVRLISFAMLMKTFHTHKAFRFKALELKATVSLLLSWPSSPLLRRMILKPSSLLISHTKKVVPLVVLQGIDKVKNTLKINKKVA